MNRMLETIGYVIRYSFLLVGLAAGLWLLYTAGPGWEDYKPRPGRRGGVPHTPMKTNSSRLWMLGAGLYFAGGSAYVLTMTVRDRSSSARARITSRD